MRTSILKEATARLQEAVERAKKNGAGAAKIALANEESLSCSFENGRLKGTDSEQSLYFAVTVVANGRRGSARGNRLDDLDEIVDRALQLARAGSAAHFDAYPAPADTVEVETYSAATAELPIDTMIDGCSAMVDAFNSYNPDLFIGAGASRSASEDLLVTSGGVCHSSQETIWSLGAYVQRTEGTDMLFAGASHAWRDLNDLFDPHALCARTLTDLRRAETLVDAPTGKVEALLDPTTFRMLLAPIRMGVNGRSVAKGDSPLRGRLGETILAPSISLLDDPHLDFSPGATVIDGSGIPTRKTPIVENGVLKLFLYDLDSAGLADAQPTGHDGCSPYDISVPTGERTEEAMIADMKDGIYVKSLLGFGQGNLINGDFSCNVALGYRIQNGTLTGRFKNAMIAGNIYDLFKQNVELSSNTLPGGRVPYARIEGLTLSAANGS